MIWHGMVKFWRKGNAYPCQIVAEKEKINAKKTPFVHETQMAF